MRSKECIDFTNLYLFFIFFMYEDTFSGKNASPKVSFATL